MSGEQDAAPAAATGPGKGPDALRTIGEVAALLGIKQHVLRYWEEQFPTLRPVKRSGGRRYYRPDDIDLLRTIHRLIDQQGYTLRGAKLAIEAAGAPPPGPAALPAAAPPPAASGQRGDAAPGTDTLVRLRHIRRMLSEALAAS